MIPNFLIIGAQKAGTTSIINYLAKHPDIFVPEHKEISNFFDDENYNKRFKSYPFEKYYAHWEGQKWAGNAPVNLLYFAEKTSKRIYDVNPLIKLIAILRNPIERAYSAYWFFVRSGLETGSFESALKREEHILKGSNFKELSHFTYVSHGFYYEQLMHFFKHFDKEKLLILFYNDFKSNPANILKYIYNFLEVEEYFQNDFFNKKYNVSSRAKIQSIHDFFYGDRPIKRIYKKLFPESLRYKIKTNFIWKVLNRNLEPFNYPPMKATTKQYLEKIFEEPNNKLQELLGRDLNHWHS